MLDVQTIRNLFEAYLQTSFLSPEDVADLIRIHGSIGARDLVVEEWDKIRNEYLDDVEENEPNIEQFIDRLFWYIS